MSKLYCYRNGTKDADGDGTLSETEEFSVTITEGSVKKGLCYEIWQGAWPSEDKYNCLAGAGKGERAKFKKANQADIMRMAEEQFSTVAAFESALEAVHKKVTIRIDDEDLSHLKTNKYRLCFAKKVGEEAYNVVWQSYSNYLSNNNFSWTPQYQLFGSKTFKEDITVEASTDLVTIGLGQTSTLDAAGVLRRPKTGGPSDAITMVNNFGSIHPGLNQLSTGIDGKQVSMPIYVATLGMVKGDVKLKPIEKVLVWFEQNIVTSTMFSDARTNPIEIDLTFSSEETRLYKNDRWWTP